MPTPRRLAATSLTRTGTPFEPMEAKLVEELPHGRNWQFEPKWDGFRCLAVKNGNDVQLYAKSGKPLARYFPDIVEIVGALPGRGFVLDGELAIPLGGTLSFDALQMRLHPAESRVQKLAREAPAIFILFDLPVAPGWRDLTGSPLAERRAALEHMVRNSGVPRIRLSPFTRDRVEAAAWLARAGGALDGVVAKRLDGPYECGERAMLKVKRIRTADCVVGGFRYGTGQRLVASLLLGLYDADGHLDHVGFSASLAADERRELTARLEALADGPGFTGKAPGGPSRWSTERSGDYVKLRHELVVEVSYDHVTGDRFRHGTRLLRFRPDKAPRQCTLAQLEREVTPGRLVGEVIGV